jgi:hypothetical protein
LDARLVTLLCKRITCCGIGSKDWQKGDGSNANAIKMVFNVNIT